MGKDSQDQLFTKARPGYWVQEQNTIHHEPAPPLICKKWLCIRFDLVYPSGRVNVRALYSKVLTPAVIQGLGMSESEIRSNRLKMFDRQQTVLLIRLLDL